MVITLEEAEEGEMNEQKVIEVYESCGCEVGNCRCYDCQFPGCDNYRRDGVNERYCDEHRALNQSQQQGESK